MAFEVALRMQKRGLDVAKVIAFDTHGPRLPASAALAGAAWAFTC